MNVLLGEMAISLDELQKGRAGQLNMTQKMEDLAEALSINQVPGRNPFHKASWEKYAWPSMKNLATWYPNMILRCDALEKWTEKVRDGCMLITIARHDRATTSHHLTRPV